MSELSTVVVGIDIGDRTVDVCVLVRQSRKVERRVKVPTERGALERLFASLPRALVVIETGTHTPWIARLVEAVGHEALVADARRIQLIAKSKRKSDRRDAELLARLGCTELELLCPVKLRGERAQQHRAVLKMRDAAVQARSKLINNVRGTMKSLGYRIERCTAEAFPKRAWSELPEAMRRLAAEQLVAIRKLSRTIGRYDTQLHGIAREYEPQLGVLVQVPGVADLTALAVLLAMGDPARFRHSRDFAAFLGLVPARDQSGEHDPDQGISKTGDTYARRLLVSAAHCILNRGPDSDLKRWGLALAARYGPKKLQRAAVALARKLAVLLHRLAVTGEDYEPLRNAARLQAQAASSGAVHPPGSGDLAVACAGGGGGCGQPTECGKLL